MMPSAGPDGDDHLLRVTARALDEGAQVAGAGDDHRARQRVDPQADRGHEQVGLVAGDDRVVQQREDGAWRLAAREVLPQQPAQARDRNRRARAVAADVGDEHGDVTLAVLDDLEEVAAVADGSVLPGRDAQLAPGRQVDQLRPAACGTCGSRNLWAPAATKLRSHEEEELSIVAAATVNLQSVISILRLRFCLRCKFVPARPRVSPDAACSSGLSS